jgi:hypothetical protein
MFEGLSVAAQSVSFCRCPGEKGEPKVLGVAASESVLSAFFAPAVHGRALRCEEELEGTAQKERFDECDHVWASASATLCALEDCQSSSTGVGRFFACTECLTAVCVQCRDQTHNVGVLKALLEASLISEKPLPLALGDLPEACGVVSLVTTGGEVCTRRPPVAAGLNPQLVMVARLQHESARGSFSMAPRPVGGPASRLWCTDLLTAILIRDRTAPAVPRDRTAPAVPCWDFELHRTVDLLQKLSSDIQCIVFDKDCSPALLFQACQQALLTVNVAADTSLLEKLSFQQLTSGLRDRFTMNNKQAPQTKCKVCRVSLATGSARALGICDLPKRCRFEHEFTSGTGLCLNVTCKGKPRAFQAVDMRVFFAEAPKLMQICCHCGWPFYFGRNILHPTDLFTNDSRT